MEAGFSSYAMGWTVAAATDGPAAMAGRLLELALRFGYQRLQIADNCPLHVLTVDQRRDLRARADEAGVSLEVGTRGLTAGNLEAYVTVAAELGSPLLRIVIDERGYEPGHETIVRMIRAAIPTLERAGVTLAIENHDRFKVADLARIISTVDSRHVGICLDTANSLGAAEDLRTVVRGLGPCTVNLHLKDVRVRRLHHQQGFTIEGTVLGEGQLPLEWALREPCWGRCQTAILEHWVPPEDTMEKTLQKELQWCERSTAALHRLLDACFG